MEVIVAKSAGFCFGVDNAVSLVNKMLDEQIGQLYTLGPVIHNKQVVNDLSEKGVRVINAIEEACENSNVVIRAHGVGPGVYEKMKEKNLNIFDATCPFVKKIHNLVIKKSNDGYDIVIVGDKNHPEVIGINGWCNNRAYIVNSVDDVENIPDTVKKLFVVAQTTLNIEKWHEITDELKKRFSDVEIRNTICSATSTRQNEAAEISRKVDMMIVIGGKNSSNTQKLYEICKKNCKNTYQIETFGDLPPVDIKKIKKVGITAGASTPDWIIKEVKDKMEELNKQNKEMDFAEAFEKSLITLTTGEIVKGTIIGYNNAEIFVDLGYKSDGIIPVDEYSDDPDFKPEGNVKIGDEIEVFVIRVNDGEGTVLLSKKKVDAIKGWDRIEEAYKNKQPVTVKVIEVTKGGLIALSGSIRIFIPSSQVSDRYEKDLSVFLKQVFDVRITEFNANRKKVVGSRRILIEEQRNELQEKLWNSIEIGKRYTGTVKSLTNFGAFVDIGGVDGLIHITELSWNKVKHPSEVVNVGDKVEVTVLEFDKEKGRVSLGYRKTEDNPWNKAEEKYPVGSTVKGKVVRLVPFGAFVELEEGIDGLVHISQIANKRIAKPDDVLEIGQEVEAKVLEVNHEAKRISLSIRELMPIEVPQKKAEETKEEAKNAEKPVEKPEEEPTEHKEEMNVTIGNIINVNEISTNVVNEENK
ncbi:MAG TPA: bifunctional 4-hydroxy-3-methylbut-2-enyl diphosphate reductase/30S ribosomal protein S1 [Clostridiaceae bacterium]|nr:bifunctional 4-hydroxy-3-methylbut-2-enyl diphosphate reductase/30S ribosomal protein S1 [Clostridiaceae bacterium]